MTLVEYLTGAHAAKQGNAKSILRAIENWTRLSRTDAALLCSVNPASMTAICNELIENGLIRECGRAQSGAGRKPVYLELVPTAGYSACLCPEEEGLVLTLHNLHHETTSVNTLHYPADASEINACCQAISRILAGAQEKGLLGVCIADRASGGLIKDTLDAALRQLPGALSCPVYPVNVPTLSCLTQMHINFPDRQGTVASVFIEDKTVSIGVLAGDQPLFPGRQCGRLGNSFVADHPHLALPDSAYALEAMVASGPIKGGGRAAPEAIEMYACALASLLHHISCMYNPDILLIGGGIVKVFDLLAKAVDGQLAGLLGGEDARPSIAIDQLSSLSHRYGASRLAINNLLAENPLTKRGEGA